MRKKCIWILVLILLVLVGCKKESVENAILKPVNIEKLKGNLKEVFESKISQNGAYLINTGDKKQYLFLNGSNTIQGDEAVYYENVRIEDDKNIANIYFDALYTEDYKDKGLSNIQIYEILTKDTTDTIGLYKNNQQIAFDTVIGIE
ncbi:MAG: hypothetical protein CVU84_13490 [Firmicutes bacterium HGW-Firmicutes-1]|jgi:hypothetical protein|nr:MAG: hypothetical protein CVU84_13490 [Firmicutes bacterium HGW-Firmicutes-1]